MECKRRGNVCVMVAHGTPVPRPGHPRRLRRALPLLRPRLLRLLRADGDAQHRLAVRLARAARGRRGRPRARLPHLQRERRPASARRARRMSAEPPTTRTIKTDVLARVEGEGAMYVRIRDGEVEDVQLRIYEPPRFFEAFLRGRRYTEPPDITARICGICPIAYQMSACAAIEDACGVTVDEPIRRLRRLIYCGEWIESHALHVFMLHAPDFLGYESAIAMARDHREIVERGLRIKKAGNELIRWSGRPRGPSDQRARRRLLPRARQARAARARRAAQGGARARARDGALDGDARLPRPRRGLRVRGALPPRRLSARARPARVEPRARHRPRRVRGALRRGARAALERAALAACASAAPTSWGRLPATR